MSVQKAVERILKQVSKRSISISKAARKFRNLSHESLGFARIDHHRSFRKGLPEAIYAPGKSIQQIEKIMGRMAPLREPLLITRLDSNLFRRLKRRFPKLKYSKVAQVGFMNGREKNPAAGRISIVTAGTSDIPIAEEAAVTLETLGFQADRFFDMGVAGLHRLLDRLHEIEQGHAIIVCAGMEGALTSVLAGLVSKPVIAVPTSVGYGASFKGLAPLLTMMSTCAQGVAVVNIDSGFNAACFTALILNQNGVNPDDKRSKSRYNSRPKIRGHIT